MKHLKNGIIVLIVIGCVLTAGLVMAEKEQSRELNRAVIRIDTLTCGGCFSTINAGLRTLDGFSGMGANLFRKLIAVDFVEPLTQEAISKKLTEVGYPGEVKYVDAITEKESFTYIESQRSRFGGFGGGGCGGSRGCGGGNPGQAAPAQGNSPQTGGGGSCCAVPAGNKLPQGESL